MMRLGLLLMLLALSGGVAAADQDGELKAAQGELKLAQEYLQAAGRSYGEHRNEALVHVKRAIREIRLGLLDAAHEREHGPGHEHSRGAD